jgi:serine/threonine-protein kinase HipA
MPNQLDAYTPEGFSGTLAKDAEGYAFTYHPKAPAVCGVSLTMPVRARSYIHHELHPIFQMNSPEGYLREQLRQRLAKTVGMDPMLLLSLLGGESSIGRVRMELTQPVRSVATDDKPGQGESLKAILAYQGAEGLFDSLVDKYLMRSGLSGIQPKVLVPEQAEMSPEPRGSMMTSEFIVKSGLNEFPGLAINEFVCMSVVRACGIPTPDFYLSDDRKLFVMRRFDREPDTGRPIGFEDFAVLSGRGAEGKYEGSYEALVRTAALYITDPHKLKDAKSRLFDLVALSCMLGNGDAHLKNFGVLYSNLDDVELAPAYDIVNTTCYIPEDSLALSIGTSKSFFASRMHLVDFAGKCGLAPDEAQTRMRDMAEIAHSVVSEHSALVDEVPNLGESVMHGVEIFRNSWAARLPKPKH